MSTIIESHPSGHVPAFGAAAEAFLAYKDLAPSSQRAYRAALDPLVDAVGAGQQLAAVTPAVVSELFTDRWADGAAATLNVRRAAVRSFASWCEDRWPFGVDLVALVGTRTRTVDRTRSIPYPAPDALIRRRSAPLREKALWRMLYETAARALRDAGSRRGGPGQAAAASPSTVQGRGHRLGFFVASATSRLLARYLAGRSSGPLFLTAARARTYAAARDLYHPTGQARLS